MPDSIHIPSSIRQFSNCLTVCLISWHGLVLVDYNGKVISTKTSLSDPRAQWKAVSCGNLKYSFVNVQSGKLLAAKYNGQVICEAERSIHELNSTVSIQAGELFELEYTKPGWLSLRTCAFSSRYVSARPPEGKGIVRANSDQANRWERFSAVLVPKTSFKMRTLFVNRQTGSKMYVMADVNNGELFADAEEHCNGMNVFESDLGEDGSSVALKVWFGKFISCRSRLFFSEIHADRDWIRSCESLRMELRNDGAVAFVTSSKNYICIAQRRNRIRGSMIERRVVEMNANEVSSKTLFKLKVLDEHGNLPPSPNLSLSSRSRSRATHSRQSSKTSETSTLLDFTENEEITNNNNSNNSNNFNNFNNNNNNNNFNHQSTNMNINMDSSQQHSQSIPSSSSSPRHSIDAITPRSSVGSTSESKTPPSSPGLRRMHSTVSLAGGTATASTTEPETRFSAAFTHAFARRAARLNDFTSKSIASFNDNNEWGYQQQDQDQGVHEQGSAAYATGRERNMFSDGQEVLWPGARDSPMTMSYLKLLVKELQRQTETEEREEVLIQAKASERKFTCAQFSEILKVLPDKTEQLRAALLMRHMIVDIDNLFITAASISDVELKAEISQVLEHEMIHRDLVEVSQTQQQRRDDNLSSASKPDQQSDATLIQLENSAADLMQDEPDNDDSRITVSNELLSSLMEMINYKAFGEDKLQVLSRFIMSHKDIKFSLNDVLSILEILNFEDEKLKGLDLLLMNTIHFDDKRQQEIINTFCSPHFRRECTALLKTRLN